MASVLVTLRRFHGPLRCICPMHTSMHFNLSAMFHHVPLLTFSPPHTLLVFLAKVGLWALLTEECMIPKGSDGGFTEKVHDAWKSKSSTVLTAVRGSSVREGFQIDHFAGAVPYRCHAIQGQCCPPQLSLMPSVASRASCHAQ